MIRVALCKTHESMQAPDGIGIKMEFTGLASAQKIGQQAPGAAKPLIAHGMLEPVFS